MRGGEGISIIAEPGFGCTIPCHAYKNTYLATYVCHLMYVSWTLAWPQRRRDCVTALETFICRTDGEYQSGLTEVSKVETGREMK